MDGSGSIGSGSQSQSTSTPRISVLVKQKPQYIQCQRKRVVHQQGEGAEGAKGNELT